MRSVTIRVWVGQELLSSDLVDEFSRTIGSDGVLSISASRRGVFAPFQVTAEGLKVVSPLAGEEALTVEKPHVEEQIPIAQPKVAAEVKNEDIKPFDVPMITFRQIGEATPGPGIRADYLAYDEPFMAFNYKGETSPPAQDLLSQLHAALGWQGGTVHDALAHVRELRERAEALTRILGLLGAPTVKDAGEQIHAGNCSRMLAEALVKAAGTASAVEVAQMRAKAESLDALLKIIGTSDVEMAKTLAANNRSYRETNAIPLRSLREALRLPEADIAGYFTAERCLDVVAERTKALGLAWLDKSLPIATPEPPSLPDPDGGDILLELANEETDPKLREEILARRIFGIDKHKKLLQRRNGRGHHNDYRQELIDAWAYARAGNVGKNFEALLREMLMGRDPMAGILSALEVSDVVQAHVRIDELRACEKGLAEIRRVPHVGKDASPLSIADLLKRGEEDRQSIQAIRNSFAELDATPTIRNTEEPVGTQVAKLFDAICGAMCETDLSRAIQGAEYNYNLANKYRALATTLETIDATVVSLGGDPPEVVMVARVEPDVCQRIGKNPGLYSTVKVVIGEGA